MNAIPFIDLAHQQLLLKDQIDRAIHDVLSHGKYVLGPEVSQLEHQLAAMCGSKHVISCASGTDALLLALLAWDTRPGHAVFVPAFTFVATAEVVAILNATPVFVDIDNDSYNMNVESFAAAIEYARRENLTPHAVLPVDMFGQPADYPAIRNIAVEEGIHVIADAAQSFGGSLQGRKVGTLAPITATSFYPAKPLGCYGDGGAVFTDNDDLAATMQSIRNHGQDPEHARYFHSRLGFNSRLDTIQAAVLLAKLTIFEDEIGARQLVANRYNDALKDVAKIPLLPPGAHSAWAQYTIRVPYRDKVIAGLKARKIPVAIHYPRPLHEQPAYVSFPRVPTGLEVAKQVSREVLSLPMHPYLDGEQQDQIISAVRQVLNDE